MFSNAVGPMISGEAVVRVGTAGVMMTRGNKSVLYPEGCELRVKVNGPPETYAPAAMINANLQLRGGASGSINRAFGVRIFDEGVEQLAQAEEEQDESWYGEWGNLGGGHRRRFAGQPESHEPYAGHPR